MSVGYSGGPETAINVTDLIWKAARILGFTFSMFSLETIQAANQAIFTFLLEGRIKPAVARTFLLEDKAEAQRYLIEDRPFGRVLLTI